MSFAGPVNVPDWLPANYGKRQAQVDQIAFGMKHAVQSATPVVLPAIERETPTMAVLAELAELQAQLGQLGDQLAGDAFVLAHHPEVQILDAAGQQVGRIIKALQNGPSSQHIG